MSQLKKGVVLSFLNIFLLNAIGLVITPFIIRSLGNSEYGLYTLIGSFVAYLSLMDLGLNNTIVRFVSRYRALKDLRAEQKFLGTTMVIYFIISIVLVIIGLILYFNLDKIFSRSLTFAQIEDARIMFLVLIFNLAITLPGGSFTAICNAYEHFVFPRSIGIIRYLLRALTVVTILNLGGKAIALVIVDTVFNVIVVIVTIFYVFSRLKVKFNFSERTINNVRQIFSYSIWIFLLAISTQFIWNAGQFVLGIETKTEVVAIFAIGIMLGGFYGSFSTAVSSVFLPRANQMSLNNSQEEILEMMIKIGRLSFMLLMFVFTGFISLGQEFIFLWIGEDYYQSWIVALLMMALYTIPLIQNFANSLVEAYNKVAVKVRIYMICFISGLVLGYFLIPQFQAVGMMIGIGCGWFIAQICMNIYYHRYLKLNILLFYKKVFNRTLLPIVILCVSLNFINHLFHHSWWSLIIKIVIYSIFYWGVLFLYSMNLYEKQLIKAQLWKK